MLRPRLRSFVLVAALAVAALFSSAQPAEAGWWHHHWWGWWGGCCPSYVTVYRPVYTCWDWGWCCDPCSVCCCNPCCCVWVSDPCCVGEAVVVEDSAAAGEPAADSGAAGAGAAPAGEPKPAAKAQPPKATPPKKAVPEPSVLDTDPEPAPAPPTPDTAPAGRATQLAPADGTLLTVRVPTAAKVYINGQLTRTPGSVRQYVSRGLLPGYRYTYEVRAVVDQDGREVSDTQVVRVQSGEIAQLAFALGRDVPEAVATTLTLHVPADAQVVLAGNSTSAQGTVRQYRTTDLARGQRWDNYRVVVTAIRDGRPVRQEKTLRLTGGDAVELRFTLDAPQVAQR